MNVIAMYCSFVVPIKGYTVYGHHPDNTSGCEIQPSCILCSKKSILTDGDLTKVTAWNSTIMTIEVVPSTTETIWVIKVYYRTNQPSTPVNEEYNILYSTEQDVPVMSIILLNPKDPVQAINITLTRTNLSVAEIKLYKVMQSTTPETGKLLF